MGFSFFAPRLRLLAVGFLPIVLLLNGCGESQNSATGSPTGPGGTGIVSGVVILGSTAAKGITKQAMPIGLAGVTVRVSGGGSSTTTDGSGQFTLMKVPAGNAELEFERQDINARGRVVVTAGAMNNVTVSIVGSRAEIVPGEHSGAEVEGLVSATNATAGTLTVLDQRLGAVMIQTDGSTVIRNEDDATIPFSQIEIGNRVHVKALSQPTGAMLATEIILQSDKVGGNREVEGSVTMVDQSKKSFVVQTESGTVTVQTDSSTTFRRRGGSASFSDIAMGANVDVNGILQADGTVLARKVTIEG